MATVAMAGQAEVENLESHPGVAGAQVFSLSSIFFPGV